MKVGSAPSPLIACTSRSFKSRKPISGSMAPSCSGTLTLACHQLLLQMAGSLSTHLPQRGSQLAPTTLKFRATWIDGKGRPRVQRPPSRPSRRQMLGHPLNLYITELQNAPQANIVAPNKPLPAQMWACIEAEHTFAQTYSPNNVTLSLKP